MSNWTINKTLFVFCVRYAPVVLLLSISSKIYCIGLMNVHHTIINWINLIFNLCILFMVYIQGKELKFCWIHKSLCRAALWGLIYYAAILTSNSISKHIEGISLMYFITAILLLILYEILRRFDINCRCCGDTI